MPLKISKFSGPGSTPKRRMFWDNIVESVTSERKLPGKHVVVTEDYGYGSLIDVIPQRAKNQMGACCTDGVCTITTEEDCAGNYLGNGTNCEGIDCTQGACCVDGVCSITTEGECTGHYRGDGTTCEDTTCPPMGEGACCHTDGSCTIETSETCDGAYQGDNVPCSDVDCNQTGACCDGSDCSITRRADCVGRYLGDGVPCDPNLCPDCQCGFLNACDGLYYKSVTYSGSGTYTETSHDPDTTTIWSFTSEVTFTCNSDGTVSCEGSGSGTWFVDGVLQFNYFGDCGPTGDTNTWDSLGGTPYWHLDGSGNCTPCPKDTGFTLAVDTCNHKQYTKTTGPAPDVEATIDEFISYSDPCVPTGFSPPP